MKKRLGVLLVICMVFSVSYAFAGIKVETSKKKYLHHEIVSIKVKDDTQTSYAPFSAKVYRNKILITTVGNVSEVYLKFNVSTFSWEGNWPVPYNAPTGTYTLVVNSNASNEKPVEVSTNFEVIRRTPPEIENGECVVTLETSAYLQNAVIIGPDGTKGDWKNLIKWAKFMGADTVWYLAGITTGWKSKISDDAPWLNTNLSMYAELAREAHKQGLKFGAWIACYLTFGDAKFMPDKYTYALNYNEKLNACVATERTISIGDKKRLDDIVDLIKRIESIPEVDYVGLDYFRAAYGGYEMIDEFISDMNPVLPKAWHTYSSMQKMCWLAIKVRERKDMNIVEQWNWWRAHYMSGILEKIKVKSSIKKPLWIFTLSWEKGWQHGQDPVMFNDAGMDIDAVMLYQATRDQFDDLIKKWHAYVEKDHANVYIGNQVDWYWHQKTLNPSGPEEFYDRLRTGSSSIYKDGPAKGIFWHDLSRGLWGRKGPYKTMEWAVAGSAAFSRMRLSWQKVPLCSIMVVPEEVEDDKIFKVAVEVVNLTQEEWDDIEITILPTEGVTVIGQSKKIVNNVMVGGVVGTAFQVKINDISPEKASRYMIASEITWPTKERIDKYTSFKYVNVFDKDRIIKEIKDEEESEDKEQPEEPDTEKTSDNKQAEKENNISVNNDANAEKEIQLKPEDAKTDITTETETEDEQPEQQEQYDIHLP